MSTRALSAADEDAGSVAVHPLLTHGSAPIGQFYYDVAGEISERLVGTFRRDGDGHRPVHGGQPVVQNDAHWRDLILFYEYLHGDNGAGIGASHQTGWTGVVGVLPLLFRGVNAGRLMALRKDPDALSG